MAQLKVKQIAGIQAYIQNLIDNDADQNAGLIDALEASVDSLESALSQEIYDLGAGADASIDSLESALSTEIVTTNGEVNGINASINSLESQLSTDIYTDNAEIEALEDSVDSLESALSTEIVTTNGEIKDLQDHDSYLDDSVDSLESALSTHMAAIYAIADDSDGILENFSEVVNFVVSVDTVTDGMVTNLTNALAASVDSLESALSIDIYEDNAEIEALEDSVDSLESALSQEIYDLGAGADASIDSLESALSTEIVTTNGEVNAINNSIDSLESALSTDIYEDNAEIEALEASVDSLETQVDEIEAAGMRVHQMGTVSANAFTLPLAVDVSADSDIVVFVNGKNEVMAATPGAAGGWASADGINFTFTGAAGGMGYDVDATDEVYVVAPLLGTGSGSGQGTDGGDWEPYNPTTER